MIRAYCVSEMRPARGAASTAASSGAVRRRKRGRWVPSGRLTSAEFAPKKLPLKLLVAPVSTSFVRIRNQPVATPRRQPPKNRQSRAHGSDICSDTTDE